MRERNEPVSVDGIEPSESVIERCKKFISNIVEKAESNKTILAFSHASTLQRLMQYIVQQDLSISRDNQKTLSKGLKNTMFNHVRITKQNNEINFKVISVCNRDHLETLI